MYNGAATANLLERDQRTAEVFREEILQTDGLIEVDVRVDEGTTKILGFGNPGGSVNVGRSGRRAPSTLHQALEGLRKSTTVEEEEEVGGGMAPPSLVGTNTLASTRCRSGDGQL